MKKQQATTPTPPDLLETPDALPAILGKDEMNLAEYPFALLTHRIPPKKERKNNLTI